jgi:3-methylcrotonyl-CoA carboxylase alpha subunit
MSFNKILIANRGEIAVRIIRACREMGISPVAVYSEVDRTALHVRLADQAYLLGPAPVQQSYLSIERILQAAVDSGAEAIHPGYGFLSENTEFARAATEAGLVFIGPPVQAIAAMGDKAQSRDRVGAVGVAVVPGYQGSDGDLELEKAALQLGFPVLVKASAGGGGKGMRIVWKVGDLVESVRSARREAIHAFGDGRLLLERYVPDARHVEIQILADQHGKILHLFERECSVQRRHQKVIEESPSPLLDEALRVEMGEAAIAAAKAVGYQNAGTVEFIVNPYTNEYYFLEMNTRLQVEHPVTEMVTGLDIVQWQIKIAAGEPLPFDQHGLQQQGHAIQCRLYAEDPQHNFLPATGPLLRFIEPRGPGVRVDTGFTSGDEITLHYDPLVAKLIVHAEDRRTAIRRMVSALRSTVLLGLTSNNRFLQDVLEHPDFQTGQVHTTWLEEHFEGWTHPVCKLPPEVLIAAALTQFQPDASGNCAESSSRDLASASQGRTSRDPFSPWRVSSAFRSGDSI